MKIWYNIQVIIHPFLWRKHQNVNSVYIFLYGNIIFLPTKESFRLYNLKVLIIYYVLEKIIYYLNYRNLLTLAAFCWHTIYDHVVNYTGTQSFLNMLFHLLAQTLWVLLLNLDWIVQTNSAKSFLPTMLIYRRNNKY